MGESPSVGALFRIPVPAIEVRVHQPTVLVARRKGLTRVELLPAFLLRAVEAGFELLLALLLLAALALALLEGLR